MIGRLVVMVAACLLLAAAGPAAAQDYRELYRRGYQAVDARRWAEAERLLRQAIAEKPEESTEEIRITGTFFRSYLPHFKLGVVLLNQQRFDEALQEFRTSERFGAVQRSFEAADLSRYLQHPAIVKAIAIAAQRQKDEAARAARAADRAPETSPAPPPAAPPLTTAPPPPTDPAPAREADRRVATPPDVPKPEVTTGSDRPVPAPGAPGATRPPATPEDVRVSARSPAGTGAGATAAPVAAPTPAALEVAVRSYFRGEYRDVERSIADLSSLSPAAAAEALFLRGAARYARFAMGGGKDDRLRAQALQDLKESQKADPSFAPNPQFFSPAVVALHKAAR